VLSGQLPYHQLKRDTEVLFELDRGVRPPRPPQLENEHWALICRCWTEQPSARPDARDIFESVQHHHLALSNCQVVHSIPPSVEFVLAENGSIGRSVTPSSLTLVSAFLTIILSHIIPWHKFLQRYPLIPVPLYSILPFILSDTSPSYVWQTQLWQSHIYSLMRTHFPIVGICTAMSLYSAEACLKEHQKTRTSGRSFKRCVGKVSTDIKLKAQQRNRYCRCSLQWKLYLERSVSLWLTWARIIIPRSCLHSLLFSTLRCYAEVVLWWTSMSMMIALCIPNSNSDLPFLLLKACPSNRSGYESTAYAV
jgi:hypothetical protein